MAGLQWIESMQVSSALLGALVAVMNPEVYNTGVRCIQAFNDDPDMVAKSGQLQELLEVWSSPYPVVSLISNQDSPLHRDNGGDYSSMDLLASVGDYVNGRFNVPGLGPDLLYSSGTVIGVASWVVHHRATARGQQLCLAMWLQQNVLASSNIPAPDWVQIQDLEMLCSK